MLVDCLTEGLTHISFDSVLLKLAKISYEFYYALWIKSGHNIVHMKPLKKNTEAPMPTTSEKLGQL